MEWWNWKPPVEHTYRCQLYLPRIMVIVHTLARDLFTAWYRNLLSLIGNFTETDCSSSVEYFLQYNMTVRGKLFISNRRCGYCCFNNSVFTYPIGSRVSLMADAKLSILPNKPTYPVTLFTCLWLQSERPAIHHMKREGMCGKSWRISCLCHASALPTHRQSECLSCEDLCMRSAGAW